MTWKDGAGLETKPAGYVPKGGLGHVIESREQDPDEACIIHGTPAGYAKIKGKGMFAKKRAR